jgi:hypothetical protein
LYEIDQVRAMRITSMEILPSVTALQLGRAPLREQLSPRCIADCDWNYAIEEALELVSAYSPCRPLTDILRILGRYPCMSIESMNGAVNQAITLGSRGFEALMARSLLDIGALDTRVFEEIAKHGPVKDFHLALWRQEPDASGCNWNARIERMSAESLDSVSWWNVVPLMREQFNLD